jgi:hypothetical protein
VVRQLVCMSRQQIRTSQHTAHSQAQLVTMRTGVCAMGGCNLNVDMSELNVDMSASTTVTLLGGVEPAPMAAQT